MVENSTDDDAVDTRSNPMRVDRNAITVVKHGDGQRSQQEQSQQMAIFSRALERGPQRARHQEEPEEEPNCQEQLPETTDVGVFIPLMTKPEVRVEIAIRS
jgi:hypothetical protein